ncbi:hypothetical protein Pcinc_023987 [Petrolisthes cinctipes]|uniref:Uncharacterized protein n=1 Tax=Petrolisthes cinctipes TaxID=88211 RepID=A0AAE1FBV9_PETCI|nr:hypothetical protein Pcinc_023987 [Petrolisthes cinctipes]
MPLMFATQLFDTRTGFRPVAKKLPEFFRKPEAALTVPGRWPCRTEDRKSTMWRQECERMLCETSETCRRRQNGNLIFFFRIESLVQPFDSFFHSVCDNSSLPRRLLSLRFENAADRDIRNSANPGLRCLQRNHAVPAAYCRA